MNSRIVSILIVVAIIIIGGVWYLRGHQPAEQQAAAPAASTTTPAASTETTAPAASTTTTTAAPAATTTTTQTAAAPAAGPMAGKSLKIATEGAYKPFNFVAPDGSLQGFDVDIANALCAQMQAKCEVVKQDWDGMIPGLLANKYDAIVASMSITDERKQKVDFTAKYYNTPAKMVAKKGSNLQITKDGLKGKTIGVQGSTIHENFVRDNFGDVATIKAYDTQENADLDLAAGRLDAVVADKVALDEGFLKTDQGKDFEFVGPDFTDKKWFGEGAGIAVRKGEADLLKGLNDAIAAIRSDGTYQKIEQKYFAYDIYGAPGT